MAEDDRAAGETRLELDFRQDDGVACPLGEGGFARVVGRVLAEEGVGRPCLVSLSLVGDDEMRRLNREWRGQDRPTDVLSLECERPDDPDLAPGEPCELGDVVLAPAYIERQAEGFGTTWKDELTLLTIHATLHLLGYDHMEEAEAKAMEAREDALLALVGTEGGLTHVSLTRHRPGEDA